MDGKKISFGFTKTKKAETPAIVDEKIEFIECLEEQSIKVVGGSEKEIKQDLVIPMKPNTLSTTSISERMLKIAEEVEGAETAQDVPMQTDSNTTNQLKKENETLEEKAARELLEEAQNKILNSNETKILELPKLTLPKLEGEKESTLDDYDAVPINDFGLAMLRGMGWKPGEEKKYVQPQVRPKGLGLGADKPKKDTKNSIDPNAEALQLKKGAFVRVNNGKISGSYGKILGFDEDSGRVILDLALNKGNVSLNEHMVDVIPKSEYDKQFRVINSEKYEEYKRKEEEKFRNKRGPDKRKDERIDQEMYKKHDDIHNKTSKYRNSKHHSKSPDSGATNKIVSKKNNKRMSSSISSRDSPSEVDRRSNKRKKSKDKDNSPGYRRRDSGTPKNKRKHKSYSSSEDNTSTDDSYKHSRHRSHKHKDVSSHDFDKKRKGKKKRRDRSRSPPRQRNAKRSK